MDERYAARYRELYENHWWWRAREALVLDWLRRIAPVGGFGSILDVGCGDGLFFSRLKQFGEPEGIEPDASRITQNTLGKIHVQRFDRTFRPSKSYGLILLLDVIEHVDDDQSFLARALDLLATGGRLVITVPAFRGLWTTHDDINAHRTRYTKGELLTLARTTGMRVDACRYFFFWTCPIKLLTRFEEWLLPGPPTLPDIPPSWLNRILYAGSRIEQETLGHLPIPFGSSLIAVGGKAMRSPAAVGCP